MKSFKILYPVALEQRLKKEGIKKIHFIDWALLESHEKQAQDNHGQSLEKLNSRGGLSPTELFAVIKDLRYKDVKKTEYECFIWILEELTK